jgi:hypothetical protein
MYSHLFLSLPIGSLFFREPHNSLENPSIKVDTHHARTPKGDVVEVNGGVLVFTGFSTPTIIREKSYITLVVEREPVTISAGDAGLGLLHDRTVDDFFNSLETSLETK